MALTLSTMLPLGTKAPEFSLLDTGTNQSRSLSDLKSSQATVIMFICNHCPYVKHIRTKLADVAKTYQAKGVAFIAINANDVQYYPEDSPDKMRIEAETHHYTFPYLFDETQATAKAYHAVCTPEFFVFDADMKCVYRGRFDEATPRNNIPVTGRDITTALDTLLTGGKISEDQMPSMGCSIKWKKSEVY